MQFDNSIVDYYFTYYHHHRDLHSFPTRRSSDLTTRFGEPRNLAIQISDNGKVGSIVYEVPDISLVEGKKDVRNLVNNRSEEHTSELQSHHDLVCRLLLEKKKKKKNNN